jgi:hypothetical protein
MVLNLILKDRTAILALLEVYLCNFLISFSMPLMGFSGQRIWVLLERNCRPALCWTGSSERNCRPALCWTGSSVNGFFFWMYNTSRVKKMGVGRVGIREWRLKRKKKTEEEEEEVAKESRPTLLGKGQPPSFFFYKRINILPLRN